MWSYIHHMMFDPVSAWEKFKFDCLMSIIIILVIIIIAIIVSAFNKSN